MRSRWILLDRIQVSFVSYREKYTRAHACRGTPFYSTMNSTCNLSSRDFFFITSMISMSRLDDRNWYSRISEYQNSEYQNIRRIWILYLNKRDAKRDVEKDRNAKVRLAIDHSSIVSRAASHSCRREKLKTMGQRAVPREREDDKG